MVIEKLYRHAIVPLSQDPEKAKNLGQFFTGSKVSTYMSKMIGHIPNKEKDDQIRILDAGAGEGILAASAVIQCMSLGYHNIHVSLYEVDIELIPYLEEKVNRLKKLCEEKSVQIEFEIYCLDFILNRPDKDKKHIPYDIAIINPPYFKYSVKESLYSGATSDLFIGNPNIYASFVAVCLSGLSDGGQLIFITPRSFTNGLYFKGFRHYLSEAASLEEIHIFKSRDKVFKDARVLQENIICKLVKNSQSSQVIVTSSQSDSDIESGQSRTYATEFIIDQTNDLMIIHIPESDNDAEIMKQANQLKSNFTESGYRISTGPVVEHRTRVHIYSKRMRNNVPLLRPHNVSFMHIEWTGKNKKDVSISTEPSTLKHLLVSEIHVVLKRFSSKDERKRLTAGVYIPDGEFQYIGLGNKLNYIVRDDEKLGEEEALGLAAILNSTFMDSYFRCLSGNTQVNATEVRIMKFPTRAVVCKIGERLAKKNLTQDIIDHIVIESLFGKEENGATNSNREA